MATYVQIYCFRLVVERQFGGTMLDFGPIAIDEDFRRKVSRLPNKPGVYLFLGENRRVIYVGKAVSLVKRVRSYFSKNIFDPKTQKLVENIKDVNYIVTNSEAEALNLEIDLIKQYKPLFNIQFVDDKSYPFVKVTLGEEFPTAIITRRLGEGEPYINFGPYTNVKSLRETLKVAHRLFPIRNCKYDISTKKRVRKRPCLRYYLGLCSGPCVGLVGKKDYKQVVDQFCLFLKGNVGELVEELSGEMQKAAQNLEFERATVLRDKISSLKRFLKEGEKVFEADGITRDFVGIARWNEEICFEIFRVKDGRIINYDRMISENVPVSISDKRALREFIKQYYHSILDDVPDELVLQPSLAVSEGDIDDLTEDLGEDEVISCWLSEKKGSPVKLVFPSQGRKLELVELAEKNAEIHLKEGALEEEEIQMGEEEDFGEGLQKLLGLLAPPKRIEAVDISNIKGSNAVGSLVIFEDWEPKKSDYRRFKIRNVSGIDDFAMIGEVVYRRYKRLLEEGGRLPDLLLIDGGKGQLSASINSLKKLGIDERVPVIALAKKFEEIFVKGKSKPLRLPEDDYVLLFLRRVRDEAHRFAISYHKTLRRKEFVSSVLDEIPGIGPKKKKKLLERFGSVEAIKDATFEELLGIPGISEKLAEKIKKHLKEYARKK
ncbi:MAG: excinuclease ABC subunit UvrC [Candidatus Wukongarchaeota archaeon]|nr:excinuclease ABC subunit UvrC [Candidatus Wukongarchaeota archaeon]